MSFQLGFQVRSPARTPSPGVRVAPAGARQTIGVGVRVKGATSPPVAAVPFRPEMQQDQLSRSRTKVTVPGGSLVCPPDMQQDQLNRSRTKVIVTAGPPEMPKDELNGSRTRVTLRAKAEKTHGSTDVPARQSSSAIQVHVQPRNQSSPVKERERLPEQRSEPGKGQKLAGDVQLLSSQVHDKLRSELQKLADSHEKRQGELRSTLQDVNDSHPQKHAQHDAVFESELDDHMECLSNGTASSLLTSKSSLTQPPQGQKADQASDISTRSDTEGHIEALVEAKLSVVLDVALQSFKEFASTCFNVKLEEFTKNCEQKNQAVQEELAQLRCEVNALRACMDQSALQSALQQPTLQAETGATSSSSGATLADISNIPLMYEACNSLSAYAGQLVNDMKYRGAKLQTDLQTVEETDDPDAASDFWSKSEQDVTGTELPKSGASKVHTIKRSASAPGLGDKRSHTALPRGVDVGASSSQGSYWEENKIGLWYDETSKIVRECNDPETAYQIMKQRWDVASVHISPALRPIVLQGLDEMKQRVAGYLQRNMQAQRPAE
mmetsp:Transcript_120054/g.224429  ORF Transcript_120054/g.224429 Transcript_120054/m.224429 type:complete len:552 (+) Transcript_120054:89-1744(+)